MTAAVVPQTGVARMIRDVVHAGAATIAATAVIDPAHPLVAGGAAPAYLGIEIGAQAAAALAALSGGTGEAARAIGGRLVRVRDAVFAQPSLPTGVALDVTAACTGAFAPLSTYHVEVRHGDAVAVTATISTYALGPVPA